MGGRQCCLEETPTVKRLKIKGVSSRKVFIQPSTVIPSMLNSTGHKEGMTLEESTGSYQVVLKRGKFEKLDFLIKYLFHGNIFSME